MLSSATVGSSAAGSSCETAFLATTAAPATPAAAATPIAAALPADDLELALGAGGVGVGRDLARGASVLPGTALLALLSRRGPVAAAEGREAGLRGGGVVPVVVSAAFSVPVLFEEAWVGRIMRARNPSSTLLGRLEAADAGRVCRGGPPRLGRGRVVVLAASEGRLTGALVVVVELPPSEGRPVLLTDEAVGASSEDETLIGRVALGLAVADSVAAGLLVEGCLAADAVVGLVNLDVVAADRTAGVRVAGFLCSSVAGFVTAAFAAEVARVGAAKERVGAFFAGADALTSLAMGAGAGAGASLGAGEVASGAC